MISLKKFIATVVFTVFSTFWLLAQNVVDSDLSNRAGTNKNFRSGWWMFVLVALVVLAFIYVYNRKKRSGKTGLRD